MVTCGLRISEAAGLPVTAIDRARMVLRIIGNRAQTEKRQHETKGNKERLVPLPHPVLRDMETPSYPWPALTTGSVSALNEERRHPCRLDRRHLGGRRLGVVRAGWKPAVQPARMPALRNRAARGRVIVSGRWYDNSGTKPVCTSVLFRSFQTAILAFGCTARRPTPHILWHSYATRLMENGVDARIIQVLLGHASITSAAIYTHLTEPTRASLRSLLDKIMTGL